MKVFKSFKNSGLIKNINTKELLCINSAKSFNSINKFNLFSNNKVLSKYLINKSFYNTSSKSFCLLGNDNKQKFSETEALELVEAGVFEVLKGAAKCRVEKLSRTASFKDLGFDSLDQVELVVALEEKFNINISGKFQLTN